MRRLLCCLVLLAAGCGRPHKAVVLCSGQWTSLEAPLDGAVRGTWQEIRAPQPITLPEPGYPCAAFKYAKVPAMSDWGWESSANPKTAAFSRTSIVQQTDPAYEQADFLYLRTSLYLPENSTFQSVTLPITGIDDSVRVELFNLDHPDGVNLLGDAICRGNGDATFDATPFVRKGAVNTFVLTHVDLQVGVSSLGVADVQIDGVSVNTYECP